MVHDDHGAGPAEHGTISAEQIDERNRTTLDRAISLELSQPLDWADRQFGGGTLTVSLSWARVSEHTHGVRRFGPGPRLLDHRIYERPVEISYGSEVCLIDTRLSSKSTRERDESRAQHLELPPPPPREALIPLVAALRMVLPCYLRAATELVDVDTVPFELDGGGSSRLALCFFDRTPGASGFSRFICERGLGDLLALARLVLERLVGPEFARLRHIHDLAPNSDPAKWLVGDALRWLDAAPDPPPPAPEAASEPDPEDIGGPRIEFTPGEGHGDLGRLWISATGRTDDLVWTRHRWHSPFALEGHAEPTGGDERSSRTRRIAAFTSGRRATTRRER